jgi:hypothetical protein
MLIPIQQFILRPNTILKMTSYAMVSLSGGVKPFQAEKKAVRKITLLPLRGTKFEEEYHVHTVPYAE